MTPLRYQRRAAVLAIIALMLLVGQASPNATTPDSPGGPRFVAVDIVVDSGSTPPAAYQVGLSGARGEIQIVGVEGGESAAFAEPPYYDPAALQHERIII